MAVPPGKDRAELLLRLGDAAWRDFDTRRSYEWKVNFALWTALAVLTGLLFKGDASVPQVDETWLRVLLTGALVILVGALVAVYVLVWSEGLYRRNGIDQDVAHGCWNAAAKELDTETRDPSQRALHSWRNWSHGSQIATTCILSVLLLLALVLNVNAPRVTSELSMKESGTVIYAPTWTSTELVASAPHRARAADHVLRSLCESRVSVDTSAVK